MSHMKENLPTGGAKASARRASSAAFGAPPASAPTPSKLSDLQRRCAGLPGVSLLQPLSQALAGRLASRPGSPNGRLPIPPGPRGGRWRRPPPCIATDSRALAGDTF